MFLKKLGTIILKGAAIVSGVQGAIIQQYPASQRTFEVVSSDLAQISSILTQIEVAGQALNLSGPDKLKAAAPSVAQVILQSTVLAGRKIHDPALFAQGAQKVADGMVDILNSLEAPTATSATG